MFDQNLPREERALNPPQSQLSPLSSPCRPISDMQPQKNKPMLTQSPTADSESESSLLVAPGMAIVSLFKVEGGAGLGNCPAKL